MLGAVGSRLPLPVVSGYDREAGWLVRLKDKAELDWFRATPPPRRYGALQQLSADLKTRRCQIIYAVTLGSFALAILIWNVGPAIVGAGLTLFLGRGFVDALQMVRHGIIGTARIEGVQHVIGASAVNEDVSVDGRRMNVGYDLAPVRAILEVGQAVEMQVIYAPKTRKPVGEAFAYRPAPARPAP